MNRVMEWGDLRYFLAAARAGTLVGAAKRIGSSQPTVGRRLQALERAVGQKLFQRTTEGLVLTEEGLLVLQYAERMEGEVFALSRSLEGQEGELTGQVKVSCSDWFGVYVLAPIFADFLHLHPGIRIELLTDSRPFDLNRREADLAFRIVPFEDPDIVQRKLLEIEYAAYTATPNVIEPDGDGEGQRLVTMDTQFGDMPDVQWLHQQLPQATVAFTSNSRQVQAEYCARSNGIAILPRAIGDGLAGLKVVEFPTHPPGRSVWLGYHRDLRNLARLRALIKFVTEALEADERFV
ncbi:LysR family transcriptional regulator [Microbulbifer sp. SAOS-129_SWC]|uniref:LysR family transcriptional regulator n=1 Tax=Microbulbifer sp. SAOS-129_SWC TaxID=3145235 RepID=UPI003217E3AA